MHVKRQLYAFAISMSQVSNEFDKLCFLFISNYDFMNFTFLFYRRYYDLISKFQIGLNLYCAKDFRNLNSMVTLCIN